MFPAEGRSAATEHTPRGDAVEAGGIIFGSAISRKGIVQRSQAFDLQIDVFWPLVHVVMNGTVDATKSLRTARVPKVLAGVVGEGPKRPSADGGVKRMRPSLY